MIPFLGHVADSQPLAFRAGRIVSVAEFNADVQHLAARLPSRAYGLNLCRDRYSFAVAFAAAMLRDQVNLLPPSRVLQSLREISREYRSIYALVDDDERYELDAVRVDAGAGDCVGAHERLAFAEDVTAAIAFTSGSTGRPQPSVKTWGALALGGVSEASRFGLLDGPTSVIFGTVPPQHMFGLETTVMMSLGAGLIMHSERPFFPADVQAALNNIDADRVLVTTPVHLRALLASNVELPPLRLTICATAPLSAETARRFEVRYQVAVHEVYGFTEAGMVATRRTVEGPKWHIFPKLKVRQSAAQVLVSGGHVSTEAAAKDIIEVVDSDHFVLRGRDVDLVNVAGKRTSIGYLDYQLCQIEGVKDGAFLSPDDAGENVVRMSAFAIAPGLTQAQVMAALARRIDPVFMPRPLHLVTALPRNETGKLPRNALLELAARCVAARLERPYTVSREVDATHPALAGHFPGNPVVPAVVLLDEIVEAISSAFAMLPEFVALTVLAAKFKRPVQPGESMRITVSRDSEGRLRFACHVANEIAVSGVLAQFSQADQ